jgi:S1-C subfamily serine protease
MDVRCQCTHCQARFKVEARFAGKKARCPKCQQIVAVPKESLEPQAASQAQDQAAVPAAATIPAPQPKAGIPSVPDAAERGIPSFQIQTAGTASAKSGAGGKAASAKKQPQNLLPLIAAGGIAAGILVAGGIAAAVVFSNSSGRQTGNASTAPAGVSGSAGVLILDWPASDRKQALLSIDGRREHYSQDGEIKITLPPGAHRVFIQRRGFVPFDSEITLARGGTQRLVPQWKAVVEAADIGNAGRFPIGTAVPVSSIRGFDGWLQNFEEAKRQAGAENKDILIVFGCSDVQPATQQLARMLQQAEAASASGPFVRLVIDFPRTSEGRELVQDSAQNRVLVEEFGLDRLPALAMTDARGRVYACERQWEEGFGRLPEKLAQFQQQKTQRDGLLAAAQLGVDEVQLSAAVAALKWLQEQRIWRQYSTETSAWLAAAHRHDADNQKALLEVFFEPQWLLKVIELDEDDEAHVQRVAAELRPWIDRKFRDPDRGVKLHLAAARLLAYAERFDDAAQHVAQAAHYQPKNSALAGAVQSMRVMLEDRDVLGYGTGFLVSAAGYVLTNKHVVEQPGKVEIRLPGMGAVPATIVAKSLDRDIALLKFSIPEGAQLPALAIDPAPIGRGTPVAAFGYPLVQDLGSGVKLADGLISALPDASNDSMYLLTVTINPGNSGGPLCNQQGDVAGMNTAKIGVFGEDSYGLAIPSADLVAFLAQHLPPDAPQPKPAAAADPLSWLQVDQKISRGVLMIVVKRR